MVRRFLVGAVVAGAIVAPAAAQSIESLVLRGHPQALHIYGVRGGPSAIVSSGDGGWVHLGNHVAEVLAAKGYFVIGFDTRAYLSSFTSGRATLRPEDEPGDYKVLAGFAARGGSGRPLLIGVSEGAGLSVMAAADPDTRGAIAGVLALGLSDVNELGWRWRDAVIYVTHGVPNEPTFRTSSLIDRVSPAPLAVIHSTDDEFVPLAAAQQIFAVAREPRKLWVVHASDHRFSDSLPEFDRCLSEALVWLRERVSSH